MSSTDVSRVSFCSASLPAFSASNTLACTLANSRDCTCDVRMYTHSAMRRSMRNRLVKPTRRECSAYHLLEINHLTLARRQRLLLKLSLAEQQPGARLLTFAEKSPRQHALVRHHLFCLRGEFFQPIALCK